MKKITSIILVLLLAANICGASISYHYCGKILQYFAFNGQKKKSNCCCGGTQKKKGCCKTQHYKVQVDDNQSMAKQLLFDKQVIAAAIVPAAFQGFTHTARPVTVAYSVPPAHAPPLIRTVPVYILHQQFLI